VPETSPAAYFRSFYLFHFVTNLNSFCFQVLANPWTSSGAKESAAATLFSLSVMDDCKVTIGDAGAIPHLVDLLRNGSARGRKDAVTALFNLSIFSGNKVRIIKAKAVPLLVALVR
jgi:hypothetical protein